jgi:hypothetical protein
MTTAKIDKPCAKVVMAYVKIDKPCAKVDKAYAKIDKTCAPAKQVLYNDKQTEYKTVNRGGKRYGFLQQAFCKIAG